jgi:riboflavin synthase
VTRVRRGGSDVLVDVDIPAPLRRYLAEKGSIAIDGISLTVASWTDPRLTVALIPFTLEHTNASAWAEGSRVNLEVDIVARYLERLLAARTGDSPAGAAVRSEGS